MARSLDLVAAVAIGSAAGGVARYLLSEAVDARTTSAFPSGTLLVNLLGCIALGFLAHVTMESLEFSPELRALLTTGFCGGFTTFSTFALETVRAAEEGAYRRAVTYVGGSVAAGLVGIWIGMLAARMLLHALRGEG